jgi:hypothetical protein
MQESMPAGTAERPPQAPAFSGHPGVGLDDPRALQILSTEHWSLLASRSLAYNEAFSRAGMFLSFLSATLIVMGFLVGTQGLSSTIWPIVVVLLVADLFIGIATGGRLAAASTEELRCVRGMNRIRHAYREMVPGIEPYFITSFHDDARGVLTAYAGENASDTVLGNIFHGISTTIGMVFTINAMLVGSLVGTIAIGVGAGLEVAVVVGLAAFALAFAVFTVGGMRLAMRYQDAGESRFPSPPEA